MITFDASFGLWRICAKTNWKGGIWKFISVERIRKETMMAITQSLWAFGLRSLIYLCYGLGFSLNGRWRSGFILYWYNRNVILILIFPSHGLVEATIMEPCPFPEIWARSLCSRGGCFLTSLVFLSPIFSTLDPYLSFFIYSLPLVELSWWGVFFPMLVGSSTLFSTEWDL